LVSSLCWDDEVDSSVDVREGKGGYHHGKTEKETTKTQTNWQK
jgi:hypothetical protein